MTHAKRLMIHARLLHVLSALYNLAFVYTPLHDWPHGFTIVQYISMPALIVSGIAIVRIRKLSAWHTLPIR